MKQKIYFAHPVNVFSTPLEEEMRVLIARHSPQFEIEDPNQPHHQEGYAEWKKRLEGNPNKQGGMSYYYDEVLPRLHACVSMPFLDGKFGLGVAGEAKFFIERNQPSFVITVPYFRVARMTDEEKRLLCAEDRSLVLSIEETRARTWTSPENYNKEKRPYLGAHLLDFKSAEWTSEHLKSLKTK